MDGRARKGSDARGSIGDVATSSKVELISNHTHPADTTANTVTRISRKIMGLGFAAVLVGIVLWMWPLLETIVFPVIRTLNTGPQIVVIGVIVILTTIIGKSVIPIVLDMILK